jgi:hypothetical protein
MAKKRTSKKKTVETLAHEDAARFNIPTAELESVMQQKDKNPIRVAYERRNRDLDPQLVWRGKDEQDWSDLVTHAPPLYIQEKVHPKVLIDDLVRRSTKQERAKDPQGLLVPDLYADFNGLPDGVDKTDFYQHEGNWQNRLILGDSLQVMASLAEREGLRGKVQCIYIDPPYGIKFNSNFQWSATTRHRQQVTAVPPIPQSEPLGPLGQSSGTSSCPGARAPVGQQHYVVVLSVRVVLARLLVVRGGCPGGRCPSGGVDIQRRGKRTYLRWRRSAHPGGSGEREGNDRFCGEVTSRTVWRARAREDQYTIFLSWRIQQ